MIQISKSKCYLEDQVPACPSAPVCTGYTWSWVWEQTFGWWRDDFLAIFVLPLLTLSGHLSFHLASGEVWGCSASDCDTSRCSYSYPKHALHRIIRVNGTLNKHYYLCSLCWQSGVSFMYLSQPFIKIFIWFYRILKWQDGHFLLIQNACSLLLSHPVTSACTWHEGMLFGC